jgi:hypothetical protein
VVLRLLRRVRLLHPSMGYGMNVWLQVEGMEPQPLSEEELGELAFLLAIDPEMPYKDERRRLYFLFAEARSAATIRHALKPSARPKDLVS